MPSPDEEVPYRWKTVRIFLSSTFRDFHAERDYLVKHVFPGLRQWCERFKLHLVDIDLRWGVTAAEAESGKVIDICLEQIDGSRPFFVCMLGNRYGWVPGPEGIPDGTMERYDRLRGKERFSITHLEIYYAILSSLITETSREEASQAFFFFREESSLPEPDRIADWSADEREEYRRAFFESDPSNAERLAELKSHIIRHYRERTDTAPVPAGSDRRIFTYKPRFNFALTNPEDGRLKGRFTAPSLRPFGRLVGRSIQKAIRSQFADRIRYFTCKEARKDRSRERDLHLDFIEIRTRLFVGREKIRRKLQSYVNGDSNRLFALSGDPGSGKSAVLAQFYQDWTYTRNAGGRDGDHLLIPHFVGAGAASSSLNHLLRRVCEEIYHHFLEDDYSSRLGSVAGDGDEAEKKRADIRREYEIPMETNRLVGKFHSFLEMATGNIVLLLDGIDQLDEYDRAHELYWLPDELPNNVKIIASATGGKARESLKKKCGEHLVVPDLTPDEQREIIRALPSVFCKTLEEHHIDRLLLKRETRHPLYLKVALEELRVFGSFERLGALIDRLPSNTVDLFVFFLERLERDHGESRQVVRQFFSMLECSRFGLTETELAELIEEDTLNVLPVLIRQVREYLYQKNGLIAFFHGDLSKAVRKKYLASAEAAHWHRKIAEYFGKKSWFIVEADEKAPSPNIRKLVEQPWQQTYQGDMWDELETTLCDLRFIEAGARASMVPELIEDYRLALDKLPDSPGEKDGFRQPADQPADATDAPRSEVFPSIRPKSEQEIRDGVSKALGAMPRSRRIDSFHRFVRSESRHLKASGFQPWFAVQHALNSADSGPVAETAAKVGETASDGVMLLRHLSWRPPFNPASAIVRSMRADTGDFRKDAIAADVSLAGAGTGLWDLAEGVMVKRLSRTILALTPDGRRGIVTDRQDGKRTDSLSVGSKEPSVELWDFERGRSLWRTAVSGMEIHRAAVASEGDRVVLAGEPHGLVRKGILCVIEGEHGETVRRIIIPSGSVECLATTPDCRTAAAAGGSGTAIRVVDLASGVISRVFHIGHPGVHDVAITPDGRWIVSCTGSEEVRCRNTVQLWDVERGTLKFALEGHWNDVIGVQVSADGRIALSQGLDRTLCVWDLVKGSLIKQLRMPQYADIFAMKGTSDARLVYTFDGPNLTVWDVENGLTAGKRQSYGHDVRDAVLSMDSGMMVTVGRHDFERSVVSIWSVGNGTATHTVEIPRSHRGCPHVEILPSGRTVLLSCTNRMKKIDLDTGGLIYDLPLEEETESDGPARVVDEELALLSSGNKLLYMDVSTGSVKRRLQTDLLDPTGTVVSPDSRIAVCGSHVLSIVDTDNGAVLQTYLRPRDGDPYQLSLFSEACFTPDGRGFVFGADKAVGLYDLLLAGCRYRVFEKMQRELPAGTAVMTPDGRFALFGTSDGTAIWSLPKKSLSMIPVQSSGDIRISPDGRYAVISDAESLSLFEIETGSRIAVYRWSHAVGRVSALTPDGSFALSGNTGELTVLQPRNIVWDPPVVTATRRWIHGSDGMSGAWDRKIRSRCPWCGRWFEVPRGIRSLIRDIGGSYGLSVWDFPSLSLPEQAWSIGKLRSRCTQCGKSLRFNPFFCDTAGLPRIYERRACSYLTETDIVLAEEDACEKGTAYSSLVGPGSTLYRRLARRKRRTERYNRMLRERPHEREALLKMGRYAMSYGAYAEALRCFERILKKDPKDSTAWFDKARVYESMSDTDKNGCRTRGFARDEGNREAIECLERVIELEPANAEAIEALEDLREEPLRSSLAYVSFLGGDKDSDRIRVRGDSLYHEERDGEALSCYQQCLDLDATDASSWLRKGLVEHRLGRRKDELDSYRRALLVLFDEMDLKEDLKDGTDHLTLLSQVAASLIELGKLREARDFIDLSLVLHPGAPALLLEKAIAALQAGHSRHMKVSGAGEAIGLLAAVLEKQAENVRAWSYRAEACLVLDRYGEVLESCRRALKLDPKHVRALFLYGCVLTETGNYRDAGRCFDRALELDDAHAPALTQKGWALYLDDDNCDPSKLLEYVDRALAVDPDSAGAWTARGFALERQNRLEDSRACFEKALAVDPDLRRGAPYEPPALLYRQSVLSKLGYARARRSEGVLAGDPEDVEALLQRGLGLKDLGRWDEELACYEKALSLKRSDAAVLYRRGDCLRRLRRHDEALSCFDRAVRIAPDHTEASAAGEELRRWIKERDRRERPNALREI